MLGDLRRWCGSYSDYREFGGINRGMVCWVVAIPEQADEHPGEAHDAKNREGPPPSYCADKQNRAIRYVQGILYHLSV